MKTSLTPLDGRYADKVSDLVPYLSEDALFASRVVVEVEWLRKISTIANVQISAGVSDDLSKLVDKFGSQEVSEIRAIDAKVNHDVKAVEIWIAEKLKSYGANELIPYVHFARTSDDINNLAYALMIKGARDDVIVTELKNILSYVDALAIENAKSAMISRTHGQPASPTTLGKELKVFGSRIDRQLSNIKNAPVLAKFNGATGTFAADYIAFPDVNWPEIMEEFINDMGLEYNPITTQIEPHDWIARLNNELTVMNTILTDLCRDIWQYISDGYLVQKVNPDEVGSSTMPHKVNPINFENAEANFGVSSALFNHLSAKLPISRLQRDLTDSSSMRALSEAYGHMLLACKSLSAGLSKISSDPDRMKSDLGQEWALLTEAVQTIMRKNGDPEAYSKLKKLSRGNKITENDIKSFINSLDINEEDKIRLSELTPEKYTGIADELACE